MSGAIELRAGGALATVRPGWGGRVLALRDPQGRDVIYPVIEAEFDLLNWPKGGAFPLIPFNGRIRNATFRFAGRDIALAPHGGGETGALHGSSGKKPWTVTARTDSSLSLALDSEADMHWPWSYRAEQHFTLTAGTLAVDLSLTNTGPEPMPGAIGWHPYFPKAVSLVTDADRSWRHDSSMIPVDPPLPAPGDLSNALCFLGGTRTATLQSALLRRIHITASPELDHMVTLDREPGYTCVEPVSHLANHIADGTDARYCTILTPGQQLFGRVDVEFA